MKNSSYQIFEKKKSLIHKRLKAEYIDNGIATIPVRVSEYSDVISRYSTEGYEFLEPEFSELIKETVDVIPEEYPIVLNITGGNLTGEQKNVITETIKADFDYDLGCVEEKLKHHRKVFVLMLLGVVISGLLLYLFDWMSDIPKELLFVLFWYMGDAFIDYFFLGGYDLRKEHLLAGRLALIQIYFSENYDESEYSPSEVRAIMETLVSETEKE